MLLSDSKPTHWTHTGLWVHETSVFLMSADSSLQCSLQHPAFICKLFSVICTPLCSHSSGSPTSLYLSLSLFGWWIEWHWNVGMVELISILGSNTSSPKPGSVQPLSNPGQEEGCEGGLTDAGLLIQMMPWCEFKPRHCTRGKPFVNSWVTVEETLLHTSCTHSATYLLFLFQFPITALREIKILQLLKHENVVNLIEICRTKGWCDSSPFCKNLLYRFIYILQTHTHIYYISLVAPIYWSRMCNIC